MSAFVSLYFSLTSQPCDDIRATAPSHRLSRPQKSSPPFLASSLRRALSDDSLPLPLSLFPLSSPPTLVQAVSDSDPSLKTLFVDSALVLGSYLSRLLSCHPLPTSNSLGAGLRTSTVVQVPVQKLNVTLTLTLTLTCKDKGCGGRGEADGIYRVDGWGCYAA